MIFEKILELADNEKVKLAQSFKDEINKRLHLGMSAYVCKYGTLSDGHDKITDAQRYFQSYKEMYNYSNSIENNKVIAMAAQADLVDAEDELSSALKASDKLRAESKILKAKIILTNALVTIEDLTRQLNAFDEVRLELMDKIETLYPNGIEQAEEDSFTAVAKYKMLRKRFGYTESLHHLPLKKELKAKLGLENNAPEMAAWMSISEPEKFELMLSENNKALDDKRNNK